MYGMITRQTASIEADHKFSDINLRSAGKTTFLIDDSH